MAERCTLDSRDGAGQRGRADARRGGDRRALPRARRRRPGGGRLGARRRRRRLAGTAPARALARARARPTSASSVVELSRNFGHQAALTAGLEHARGDAVVMIDGDLQDPPEVIPEMLERWRDGRRRRLRGARRPRRGRRAFKLDHGALVLPLVRRARRRSSCAANAGDFRLMDRRALDALLRMPERNRFLRGMTRLGRLHARRRSRSSASRARRARRSTRCASMLRFSFDAITSLLEPRRCRSRRSSASSARCSRSWRSR